jgi:hypothetical protein
VGRGKAHEFVEAGVETMSRKGCSTFSVLTCSRRSKGRCRALEGITLEEGQGDYDGAQVWANLRWAQRASLSVYLAAAAP